jgi:hypothetical protein
LVGLTLPVWDWLRVPNEELEGDGESVREPEGVRESRAEGERLELPLPLLLECAVWLF